MRTTVAIERNSEERKEDFKLPPISLASVPHFEEKKTHLATLSHKDQQESEHYSCFFTTQSVVHRRHELLAQMYVSFPRSLVCELGMCVHGENIKRNSMADLAGYRARRIISTLTYISQPVYQANMHTFLLVMLTKYTLVLVSGAF